MTRRRHAILEALIADIVQGQPAEGEQLPRENDLAEHFGASRGVIRECMRALEERRLVTVVHGRGATVMPFPTWDLLHADLFAAVLRSPRGKQALDGYLETRRMVEPDGMALIAERCTIEQVDAMTAVVGEMRDLVPALRTRTGRLRFDELDETFREVLWSATGNHTLAGLARRLVGALGVVRETLLTPEHRFTIILEDHRSFLDAFVAGDADAARHCMLMHLDRLGDELRRWIADNAAQAPPSASREKLMRAAVPPST